jgi:hypothetical protein
MTSKINFKTGDVIAAKASINEGKQRLQQQYL